VADELTKLVLRRTSRKARAATAEA
jgi:hypothetical protein